MPQDYSEGVEHTVQHGCCWHRLDCLPKSVRDVLRSILDTSTFSSPTFVLLSIASFFTMLGKYPLPSLSYEYMYGMQLHKAGQVNKILTKFFRTLFETSIESNCNRMGYCLLQS